jgi:hypothetical protein
MELERTIFPGYDRTVAMVKAADETCLWNALFDGIFDLVTREPGTLDYEQSRIALQIISDELHARIEAESDD